MKKVYGLSKGKKGSHIGFLLSFTVFIGFLIFLYTILSPSLETNEEEQFAVENLKIGLIEKASVNFTSVTIKIDANYDPEENCILIAHPDGTDGTDCVVENITGELLKYEHLPEVVRLKWKDPGRERLFKIHYAEGELKNKNHSQNPCASPTPNDQYFIEMIKTNKYVFVDKISQIIEEYESNYSDLKQELEVPNNNEFGFSFKFSNDSIIKTQEKNVSTDVYVKEIPIAYLEINGTINTGFINIKVW